MDIFNKNLSTKKRFFIYQCQTAGLLDQIYLTGSFSLFAYGVIDREIGDLDFICLNKNRNKIIKSLLFKFNIHPRHLSFNNVNRSKKHLSFITNGGVNICIFFIKKDDEFRSAKMIKLSNDKIHVNCCHPAMAIEAKKKYIEEYSDEMDDIFSQMIELPGVKKHKRDIELYKRWKIKNFLKHDICNR